MHYYKRNIGDYSKKAGRLTMLQHGAYTLLIDSCYDRERFPTLDEAIEWTWASTEAEIEAVKFVINRFFSLDKEGQYVQDRILAELLNYHKNADINKRIANDRETKRKEKRTNREQFVDEAPPNHKPITNNHKPNKATSVACPDGLDVSLWVDFLTMRRAKKLPMTQTALDGLSKQAEKIGWTLAQVIEECVNRGWGGFKAEWLTQKNNVADISRITVPGKQERDPALVKLDQDREITKPPSLEVLARMAQLRAKQ